MALALGIFSGAVIGLPHRHSARRDADRHGHEHRHSARRPLTGYLHSIRPVFGRIPDGAISLMTALGLASFVAMIGLSAGPHFIEALREAGVGLFFGGMVVTLAPLVVGLYFGCTCSSSTRCCCWAVWQARRR